MLTTEHTPGQVIRRVTTTRRAQRLAHIPVRVLLLAALTLAFVAPAAEPAGASTTWVVNTASRTEAQVQQRWAAAKPSYSGGPYAVTPSITSPYSTGAVAPGFLADGLKMLNYARYLAGLPDDVVFSAGRNSEAQHGAVLLAASGTLSHTPAKPSDMSQAFYDVGLASTSTSNIGSGYTSLSGFQTGCLSDSTGSNLERVGHRRWILNPPLKVTGMGYAERRVTTYVFDKSRSETVQYSAIAWPSAGAFPVQMFCSYTPWSITLNPAQFDIDQTKAHAVTLRRVADEKTWTFSDRTTSTSGQYFRTDFSGMGVRNVFIFRPAPTAVQYRPGDEFDVTLSVYVKGQATPRSVSYRTRFVSMLERDGYEPDDSRQTARELLVGQTQPRTFDVEGDQDWVYFDARKGVKLQIASPGVAARLYNASNQLLQTFSGAKTEWTPPADGRYYLLLEGSSVGYEAKRYELSVIDPTVVPTQVMGATRYETAVEASKLAFPKGASTVVIATGRSWPDALGGTALAGVLNGPILLTDTNALPASVTQELTRLGASRAIIVGGTGAVGTAVESELVKRFGTGKVERIAGSDRYQTADKVAARVIAERGSAYDGMAFVATGLNFPDALAAAPVAASEGWPIFLVNPSAPSSAVNRPAMTPVTDIAILGGTGAVSAGVETELNKRLGEDSVERVSGACRYSTAAAVACWATERTDLRWSGLGIATGEGFPDALAGGVLQGKRGSVLLLTHPKALSPDAAATIAGTQLCISEVTFLGGTGAVAHEVRNEVIEILY
jgi:putative cell wall-binding protein/uncharacterized protein YkwD